MRRFISYFLNGLLVTVPIAFTAYIIYELFDFLDGLLDVFWPEGSKVPGMGLLVLVLVISLFGWLANTLIARPIKSWFERWLVKAPLIKTMYQAINDLVSAFVGKKKRFNQPVLIRLDPHSRTERLGFITDDSLEKFELNNDMVAVYIPHAYAFSGNLVIAHKDDITQLKVPASDFMKYIVSGGVSGLDDQADE